MTNPIEPARDRSHLIKILVGVIVVVMILVMLFPINLGGPAREVQGGAETIGVTRDGTRVSADDRRYAARLLDTLDNVYVGLRDQRGALTAACWGREVTAAFKKNPEALWLVLQESRRIGPGASPLTLGPADRDAQSTNDYGIFNSGQVAIDRLHPLPTSPLGAMPPRERMQTPVTILAAAGDRRGSAVPVTALPPLEQSQLYAALQDFLTIQSAGSMGTNALKVSAPSVDRLIAERLQKFDVDVARLDANSFAGQVGEPTDAQVAAQFVEFAAFAPSQATAANPFGFGYRVGDRVKLEWIALDRAAIRSIVEAEKTPYQWEVEARIAYKKDPTSFASLTPATTPATSPATAEAATTAPAAADFDSLKADAIRLQITRATDARLGEIERRVRSVLTSDYQAASVAKTTGAATQPATSMGVALDAPADLDAVAADVGRRFKMSPPTVVHLTDALRDGDAIAAASPAFAAMSRAFAFDPTRPMNAAADAAPTYALRTAAAAATQPSADAASALALLQPSETVTDAGGNTSAIFRVTAAEPSHPGTDVAAVRARVVDDWKTAHMQALAVRSATTAADAVRAGTTPLYSVPGTSFTSVTIGPIAQGAPLPTGLGLTPEGFAQFNDAFGSALLAGDPIAKPIAALSVPIARRVYVAQRTSLTPGWQTAANLDAAREEIRGGLSNAMSRPRDPLTNPYGLTSYTIGSAWLSVDAIFQRTGWTANDPKRG